MNPDQFDNLLNELTAPDHARNSINALPKHTPALNKIAGIDTFSHVGSAGVKEPCYQCGKELWGRPYTICFGQKYCPECLLCQICKQKLSTQFYPTPQGNGGICKACYSIHGSYSSAATSSPKIDNTQFSNVSSPPNNSNSYSSNISSTEVPKIDTDLSSSSSSEVPIVSHPETSTLEADDNLDSLLDSLAAGTEIISNNRKSDSSDSSDSSSSSNSYSSTNLSNLKDQPINNFSDVDGLEDMLNELGSDFSTPQTEFSATDQDLDDLLNELG